MQDRAKGYTTELASKLNAAEDELSELDYTAVLLSLVAHVQVRVLRLVVSDEKHVPQ